jgi:hypothetical protein
MVLDPETLIVKTGILVLATLSVIRLVLHDVKSVMDAFREFTPKKRAKKARS